MFKRLFSSPKHVRKLIFGLLLAVGIGISGLSIYEYVTDSSVIEGLVYADGSTNTNTETATDTSGNSMNETMSDITDLLQAVLKILYIVMWPLLVVAGNALDNTFVYGEFLNLDAPLFMIRNVAKNFANFALGFLVLFNILKYIFGFGKDQSKIKDVVVNALLAGVGIQVSWFVMGALIDISTIATYALGGLPMTLINQTEIGDHPIIGVHTTINLGDTKNESNKKTDYTLYYTWGEHKFAQCQMHQDFIIGKLYEEKKDEADTIEFDNTYCIYSSYLMVNISEIKHQNKDEIVGALDKMLNGDESGKNMYEGVIYTKNEKSFSRADKEGKKIEGFPEGIVVLDKAKTQEWVEAFGKDSGTKYSGKGTYLGELIESSEGFVGPLVTLYTSLLSFSDLHVTSQGGGGSRTNYATFFEFLLKAITGVVIIFPLIVLAVVLVVRIGLLRLIIALSPLLVLAGVFKDSLGKMLDSAGSKIKFDLKSIMGLIFAPIIPVFALSMSILFLYTLQDSFHDQTHSKTWEGLGITITSPGNGEQCADFRGLLETCYEVGDDHYGGSFYIDLFARLIMNGFGIGLVWVLLFASFKATGMASGIAEKVGGSIKKVAGSAPIIPIPGLDKPVGLSTAANVPSMIGDATRRKFVDIPNREANTAVRDKVQNFINPTQTISDASEHIVSELSTGKDFKNAVSSASNETGVSFNMNNTEHWKDLNTKLGEEKNDTAIQGANTALTDHINELFNKTGKTKEDLDQASALLKLADETGGLEYDKSKAPKTVTTADGAKYELDSNNEFKEIEAAKKKKKDNSNETEDEIGTSNQNNAEKNDTKKDGGKTGDNNKQEDSNTGN